MADESGGRPLPRRVPGATVSPDTPIRVERPEIPEDLRQRVLTAIADELRRDEAVARYRAQEQGNTEAPGLPEDPQPAQAGTPSVIDPRPAAALGQADLQAPDRAASAPTVWSPSLRPADFQPPGADPAASAATVWSGIPRTEDLPAPAPADLTPPTPDPTALPAPAPDPADLPAPGPDTADVRAPAPDQADLEALAPQADLQAPAADQVYEQPVPPLPRRVPGTNGAPPPPAHVRRNFLPFSLLGRRLDSGGRTESLPRITGFRADGAAPPSIGYRAEDPAATPTLPAGTPPFAPTPAGAAPSGATEASPAPSADVFSESRPGPGTEKSGVSGGFGFRTDAGSSE